MVLPGANGARRERQLAGAEAGPLHLGVADLRQCAHGGQVLGAKAGRLATRTDPGQADGHAANRRQRERSPENLTSAFASIGIDVDHQPDPHILASALLPPTDVA